MGRYNFPVKLHRFTSEEFTRKKAEYNAKYGYSVHFPGFSEIIHLGIDQPPTEEELSKYRSDRPGELSTYRWNQIKEYKIKKKQAFLRMMSSPQPTWARNVGTAMTFLDDINDTMGTVAVAMRIAAHMFPRVLGKVIKGPSGWALLVADICNIAMTLSRAPLRALQAKPNWHKGLASNPFTKKAALKRAAKMARHGITKGELIEALQVTDNTVGVGLCLGPLWGLAQDLVFGMYRVAQGKRVGITANIPDINPWEMTSQKVLKASQMLWTGGQEMSDEDHARCILAVNGAQQINWPLIQEWNPLDNLTDISAIEVRAPWPTDPTTLELFREERINPYEHLGFLHLDKEYASPIELMDVAEPLIQKSWREYTQRNKNTHMGHMVAQTVNDVIQQGYALCEGEDAVELDYVMAEKFFHKMWDNRWRLAEQDDPNALTCMANKLEVWGDRYLAYKWEQLQGWLERDCHVKFTRETPTE